ncbi:MAG: radical SAM protein [bacterium]|nr:radical SAM protein [bacterium]
MHYTGTIWRPPYEADSLLIEVTAGCTHHKCKFCTLYEDLPFKFRMSPIEDVEADLAEAQMFFHSPQRKSENKLFGLTEKSNCRVFLTGANPFVLAFEKLKNIAVMIKTYFPSVKTIGCFSRVTDIALKTDNELHELNQLGFDGLTIGIETADNTALHFMNKGYLAEDIIEQCKRLDDVGISYSFFYLTGISGAGRGKAGAKLTADACNQLNPKLIGANMLTIYHNSELYREIRYGNWREESETEKYEELKVLVKSLNIPVIFAALGASNAIQLQGKLPQDKEKLLFVLDDIINKFGERDLRNYRKNLRHL